MVSDDPSRFDDELTAAKRLLAEGQEAAAHTIFAKLAEHGHPDSIFEVGERGSLASKQVALDRLRAIADTGDSWAAYLASMALRGAWDANLDMGSQLELGSHYLKKSAELGCIAAQGSYASECLLGLNGTPKSESEYLRWIHRAIEGGDILSVVFHAKHLISIREQVPNSLRDLLAHSSGQFERSAKAVLRLAAKKGLVSKTDM